ncbi:hypothetical protein PBY51_014448 [Eleginops maclovinus]|uniref:Uncharacterized protein n=1 Tax=Eleginops maclovinus TaxID=56733 RepID=A0AAN8ACF6_ELEMC|nr:hypothetical protein PBY51_014448 [Eleginops maclovinus]
MSKNTTSPESGETFKLLGHESDNLNLPPPLEEELEDSIHDPNNIKQLVNEFKGLHVQRLRCLELDSTLNKEERQQKKVNFLWSYVNDLTDQNQVLLETIEDLQKEDKVSCWGVKLHTSDPILNVSDADLRTLFLEELVGPAANIPHSSGSLVQIISMLEDLKIQLQTKDMVICYLENTLRENSQQKQKLNERARELQEELRRKEEEWRPREHEQRLKYEKEHQKAEERGRQEQHKRGEEWVRKVDEERKAHAQAVKQWAKKTATLKSEVS